jgi:hypothetical protein
MSEVFTHSTRSIGPLLMDAGPSAKGSETTAFSILALTEAMQSSGFFSQEKATLHGFPMAIGESKML